MNHHIMVYIMRLLYHYYGMDIFLKVKIKSTFI